MTLLNAIIAGAKPGEAPTPPPFNPVGDMGWYAAYWAADPNWTPPANGAKVASWNDASGNGRHLTQATDANRPVFRSSTAAINSKPTVEFNTQNLQCSNTIFGTLSQPNSIVMIFQNLTTDGTTDNYIDGFTGNRQIVRKRLSSWSMAATTEVAGGTIDTSKHCLVSFFNTTGSALELDGISLATGNAGTQALNGLIVGGGYNASGPHTVNFHLAFLGIASGDIRTHLKWSDFKSWVSSEYAIAI